MCGRPRRWPAHEDTESGCGFQKWGQHPGVASWPLGFTWRQGTTLCWKRYQENIHMSTVRGKAGVLFQRGNGGDIPELNDGARGLVVQAATGVQRDPGVRGNLFLP